MSRCLQVQSLKLWLGSKRKSRQGFGQSSRLPRDFTRCFFSPSHTSRSLARRSPPCSQRWSRSLHCKLASAIERNNVLVSPALDHWIEKAGRLRRDISAKPEHFGSVSHTYGCGRKCLHAKLKHNSADFYSVLLLSSVYSAVAFSNGAGMP